MHETGAASDRPAAEVEIIIAVEEAGPEPITVFDPYVRVETRGGLLDRLVDFTDYRNAILRRIQSQPLPDSNLNLPDVYVPSRFVRADGVPLGDAEEFLRHWLDEQGQRQVAMLGGYGQGKSTTALMFAHRLLTAADWASRRIPILIELRGTSPRNLTPLQLLAAWSVQYNINAAALMKLHIAGKLLLIFEGFDEMALVGDAEMRLKHFRVLWQFCYVKAKILITGRPNFFLDDDEMRLALGIHVPTVGRPYCEAVRLAPFTPEQIAESLRAHPAAVREGIPPLVESNQRFADLISRPSLLHIVAVLWEKERLYEQLDRLNSAYVMELFVRHSYTRQGLKESQSPDFMALTTREREFFMQGIAAYMAASRLPNQIHITHLNRLIDELVEGIPPSVSMTVDALSGETGRPLRDRVAESEHRVEHVKTDVRACGLLVDDPAASGTFRFGHKSFMEYIFASVVADRVVNDSIVSRAVLRIANARIGDILQLPVAIEFLSELVETESTTWTSKRQGKQGKAFALQLFRATRDRPGSLMLFERLSLFLDSYSQSCRALRRWRGLAGALLPPAIVGAVTAILLVAFSEFRQLLFQRLEFFNMVVGVFAALQVVLARLTRHQRRKSANQTLWNLLCNRLNIPDEVLHRIAGTYWVPWARRQPFVYFLTGLRDVEDPRSQDTKGAAPAAATATEESA